MRLIIAGAKLGVVVGSAYVVYSIIGGAWLGIVSAFSGKNKKEEKKDEKEEA